MSADPLHDPYLALRNPYFRRYLVGSVVSLIGYQMQKTAVMADVYERTGLTSSLMYVGLAEFLPVLVLSLPAGALADRFDRKRIVQLSMVLMSVGSLGLGIVCWLMLPVEWTYLLLIVNAMARALYQPAKSSLLPAIVSREVFSNALTWNGSTFQLSMVVGPLIAGVLMASMNSIAPIYFIEAWSALCFAVMLFRVPIPRPERAPMRNPVTEVAAGLSFVWRTRLILSAISLDMFAVLLGGSVGLLPVFARVVLDLPVELGWAQSLWNYLPTAWTQGHTLDVYRLGQGMLQSAPALGALMVSLSLARRSSMERPGRLLWSVAAFGIATIGFGLSSSFWLSWLLLAFTGAVDMVSVVIRHSVVQLLTPDSMRGRVSAVNGLFIGASNELGTAESAFVAGLFERKNDPRFGPVASVVLGGIGTLVVVATVALIHPGLRRLRRQDLIEGTAEPAADKANAAP